MPSVCQVCRTSDQLQVREPGFSTVKQPVPLMQEAAQSLMPRILLGCPNNPGNMRRCLCTRTWSTYSFSAEGDMQTYLEPSLTTCMLVLIWTP